MPRIRDCAIIGAGAAGLTAAIYVARFHLETTVFDGGDSRAASIPRTLNHAGFPEGISGADLIARMHRQAMRYGAHIERQRVIRLDRAGEDFIVVTETGETRFRSVLLATGVVNHRPDIEASSHDRALAQGLLRYCPICDGYEVTDKRIGVIGAGSHGFKEAYFLRMYSRDVTLIVPECGSGLEAGERETLGKLGIRQVDGPRGQLRIDGTHLIVPTAAGELAFDSVYPALGSKICSGLASALGAATSEDGCIIVDAHQRTSIAGLYAAGDVVRGLDQISHAMGEAGVAATALRNDLAERRALLR
ncbi:NAD(P)/FAD-dependent oxidoreductase [Flavisphingomonas formosensis]|uniref:NAD(P)/FAD-dependent oxidoreductase n=1 Tax=Flavisphingomonas formosensis TaxID=861534 RepID=UPI0012FB9B7D|nr:NAD(P)/FAD-dependent oxidoreductase [Sphingomonas formosensis]